MEQEEQKAPGPGLGIETEAGADSLGAQLEHSDEVTDDNNPNRPTPVRHHWHRRDTLALVREVARARTGNTPRSARGLGDSGGRGLSMSNTSFIGSAAMLQMWAGRKKRLKQVQEAHRLVEASNMLITVRIRPLNDRERTMGPELCTEHAEDNPNTIVLGSSGGTNKVRGE